MPQGLPTNTCSMRGMVSCAFSPQHVDVDGHLAPAEEEQPARFEHFLRDRLGARLRVGVVVGQEDEAHAQVGVLVEVVAQAADLVAKNLVGQLREQARAVARLGVGVERAPVDEIAQRLQAVAQHTVGAFAADFGDEPDATGVMFGLRLVERRHPPGGFLHRFVHRRVSEI